MPSYTYTITEVQPGVFHLEVVHTCGHTVTYAYGLKQPARTDGPVLMTKQCFTCNHQEVVDAIKKA